MKKVFYIFLIVFTMLIYGRTAICATYDATGSWLYSTSDNWVNSGNAECEKEQDEQGNAIITQSGDSVTAVILGKSASGSVSENIYNLSTSYAEEGGTTTINIHITLSSEINGSGTIAWSWSAGTYSCNGGSNITITKQVTPPTYDANGTWLYSTSNNWVNPGTAGCSADPDEAGTATITQTGNIVTGNVLGKSGNGSVSGATYNLSALFSESGGTTTLNIEFTLSSAIAGSGTKVWSWTDGDESCNGGSDISLMKQQTQQTLAKGWNLISLKSSQTTTISDFYSGKENYFISIWKWLNPPGKWCVYLPQYGLDATESYVTEKGFSMLKDINPGEGFWVNISEAITLE